MTAPKPLPIAVTAPAAPQTVKISGAEFAKQYCVKYSPVGFSTSSISCGVYQLHTLSYMASGLPHVAPAMDWIVAGLDRAVVKPGNAVELGMFYGKSFGWRRCAFFVFPDNDIYKNGIALAKVIADNNLGDIVESAEVKVNPNSHNPIRVWTWAPNHKAVRAFVDAHKWGEGLPEEIEVYADDQTRLVRDISSDW